MKISARNLFEGRISALSVGPVSAEVEITTVEGDKLVGSITQGSATALGLVLGKPVVALIKASSVMVAREGGELRLSARNCLAGTVKKLVTGPVSAEVLIALSGGTEVFASITHDAASELGLTEGVAATAVFKASALFFGVRA